MHCDGRGAHIYRRYRKRYFLWGMASEWGYPSAKFQRRHLFFALAIHIIDKGGVVFGVVWKDKHTAVFDKAETPAELARMRGTKYTPAIPGNVYRNIRTELKKGRHVLFSGPPLPGTCIKEISGQRVLQLADCWYCMPWDAVAPFAGTVYSRKRARSRQGQQTHLV